MRGAPLSCIDRGAFFRVSLSFCVDVEKLRIVGLAPLVRGHDSGDLPFFGVPSL